MKSGAISISEADSESTRCDLPRGAPVKAQNKLDAIFIVNAIKVVLKKNANTQCTMPVLRIVRLVKLTSAVWPDVPMTLEKYRKSP